MSSIENKNGVHASERTQLKGDKKLTTAQKFSKFHNLDGHPYVASDKVEDVGTGRVTVIEG